MNERHTMEILREIEGLQEIQKTHRVSDPAWQTAHELLEPLFNEMARRHPQQFPLRVVR